MNKLKRMTKKIHSNQTTIFGIIFTALLTVQTYYTINLYESTSNYRIENNKEHIGIIKSMNTAKTPVIINTLNIDRNSDAILRNEEDIKTLRNAKKDS